MCAYFYSRNKHVWLWNILQHNRFFSVEKVFLSTMNVSKKLDNAVLRYSKLKSASSTLARRKSLSNLNKKTLQDRLRQVNISPLIGRIPTQTPNSGWCLLQIFVRSSVSAAANICRDVVSSGSALLSTTDDGSHISYQHCALFATVSRSCRRGYVAL